MNKYLGSATLIGEVLAHLGAVIDSRAEAVSDGVVETSWTAKLLMSGPPLCAEKVAEEGAELAEAVRGESDARVAEEAADVVYHMLVALRSRGVSMDAVADVLIKRQGISGINEKASRN